MVTQDEFSEFWKEAFNALLHRAKRFGLDQESSEDVLQDTAIEAILKLEGFRDRLDLEKWLNVAFRYRCIDKLADRALIKFTALPHDVVETGALGQQDTKTQEIRAWIECMPGRQREVIERFVAGETASEISSSMKVDVSTVRSLKRHAMDRLKRRFSELNNHQEDGNE